VSWRGVHRFCLGAILCGLSASAAAQSSAASPLTGSVALGVRSVDVDGTETKYREDVNLEDGVRIFGIDLRYRPTSDSGPVDDLVFAASNLGGDPFESVHLGVRKYGEYSLQVDRRRSAYFYEDTILPVELASVEASTAGDLHHFDFERVRDSASLDITVSPLTRLSLGLDRQTRKGESTTTLDIQRDEFELDRPLDESLNAFRIGVEHDWRHVTLIFEEELSDFENTSQILLPGASPGQSLSNPAALQFYRLDQSYDYASRSHLLRAIAEPTDRLDVAAMWRRQDLDLDLQGREQAQGTDFSGAPFTSAASGPADVGRDIEIAGLDFGFSFSPRARLVAATRLSTLDQRGRLLFGADRGEGDWTIETEGYELGAEFAMRPRLLLAGGWSTESRDTLFAQTLNGAGNGGSERTDRDGYFIRLLFTPANGFELTAAIEDNDIDDPFSLASATASRRLKLTARYAWDNGIALDGAYRKTDVENGISDWAADTEQLNLRLTYRTEYFELSSGMASVELSRDVQAVVTGGSLQVLFPVAYRADSSFGDLVARWRASERVAVGTSLRRYDNGGSFAVERDDYRVFAEYALSGDYTLEATYRDIDYVEDAYDAYDARLLELGIRLSW